MRIQFSMDNEYTTPTNGWFVKTHDGSYQQGEWIVYINGFGMFKSDTDGNMNGSMLLKKGDTISASALGKVAYFIPCRSEENDWRETKTSYDIWKNAVTENADGTITVQNLHIPDASGWYTANNSSSVFSNLRTVNGNIAYDANGNVLFNIQSEYIEVGTRLFYGSGITSFGGSLESLTNGSYMFSNCNSLTRWSIDMPKLTTATEMFANCANLRDFNANLQSLASLDGVFTNVPLVNFTSDLRSLTSGDHIFTNTQSLKSITADLRSMTSAIEMFAYSPSITSFRGRTDSLSNGMSMFSYCTALEEFTGDLTNLRIGTDMFAGCKLNKTSFINIFNCLKNKNNMQGGGANITIGANGNLRNDAEVLALLERSSINEASTNYTIYNPHGGMWSLFISWSS